MEVITNVEESRFREEVRTWLMENAPRESRPEDLGAAQAFDLAWQKVQYEGGWAGIAWPEEFGGRGLGVVQQLIWHEEYARCGAPYAGLNFPGLNLAGPTLIACGTPDQQMKHLGPILRGEQVWCQGFSEPGAGSDLASLRTSAVVDGDDLVVNGSKIWTSYGQFADWQVMLVRTRSDGKKHQGITYVLCDMRTPGIDIQPIRSMAAPDHYPFCQVFYDDVRIPLANVVGAVDDGWRVAGATLGFERGTAFVADQIHYTQVIENLIVEATAREHSAGGRMIDHGDIFTRLANLRAEFSALRAMTYWTISHSGQEDPGPASSLTKLFYGEALQAVRRLGMEVMGADKLRLSPESGWSAQYLRSFPATIASGASDIQRNIIAERLLGMPKGPKAQ